MITAEDLARELGVTGRTLRGWLRRNRPHQHGDRWLFTPAEADVVKREYRTRRRRGGGSGSNSGLKTPRTGQREPSDEHYVVGLCERILGEEASRQHRFDWLRGDPNDRGRSMRLPVNAYFERLGLVVEYRERQHFESVGHFDKPDRLTVSGVHRGEQRRIYDLRRETEIPRHGLRLAIVAYSDLDHDRRGRLLRSETSDVAALSQLLA